MSVIELKNDPLRTQRRNQAITQQRVAFDACLCAFNAFRRFGFSPSEIFLDLRVVGTPGEAGAPLDGVMSPCVGMTLRAQEKQFIVNAGPRVDPVYLSDSELAELWEEHAQRWNSRMSPHAQQEIWNRHMPMERIVALALTVKKLGFIFPNPAYEKIFAAFTAN